MNEDPNFHGKFYQGNAASKNEARRSKRSIRRINQRFKLRRDQLIKILRANKMMPGKELLIEITGEELFGLRAKAVK